MRTVWDLPPEDGIINTGREWLLHFLSKLSETQRAMTLMIIWRIWHIHNEITHDKPMPSLEGSKRFLMSYLDSLLMIKQTPTADPVKGKAVISYSQGFCCKNRLAEGRQKNVIKWSPPARDMAKLNTDGSFVSSHDAGAGMVLRDHTGQVICAAARQLTRCVDATEAELAAIEEGVALAMAWTPLQFTVESDCSEAIHLIKKSTPNTSRYASRIQIIRELLRERNTALAKIQRDANRVSHELAKVGRVQGRTETWVQNLPSEVAKAVSLDCNPLHS
jgi:hypothetical protein